MAFWRARYGDETTSSCPVCGKTAIVRNAQGLPVCTDHKNTTVTASCPNCQATLDLRDGKFGKFFLCIKCGPISMSRAQIKQETVAATTQGRTSATKAHPMMGERLTARQNAYKNPDGSDKFIRSDDPRYEFR